MFVDFHGHSRRRNAFTFGCHELTPQGAPAPTPGVLHPDTLAGTGIAAPSAANVSGRLFPKLLAARCGSFAFSSCAWAVSRDKLSSARVAMWRDALLPAAYTLEAAFGGPSVGPRVGAHASARSYEELGYAFCLALLDWLEGPTGARTAAAADVLMSARAVGARSAAGGGGGGGGGPVRRAASAAVKRCAGRGGAKARSASVRDIEIVWGPAPGQRATKPPEPMRPAPTTQL